MKQFKILLGLIMTFTYSVAQTNSISNTGNIGIGIPMPEQLLHVWLSSDSRPNGVTATSAGILKLSRSGTNNYSYNESAEFRIALGGPSVWGSKLELFVNGPYNQTNVPDQQVMTWLYNGNVGIGLSNPDSKLSVNGNIRAKEVKVETANWPDYVFAEGYELPSLQSTEQHIKEKGHLPGIPSASEVQANGINLGEMNAKLLQKIEELTLYLINVKKEAAVQGEKIGEMRQEIEKLKSKKK